MLYSRDPSYNVNSLMHCLDLRDTLHVAVMCDMSEMYLRTELSLEDRSHHRFLWRDMNVDQKPKVYEFNQLAFGVNSSPFQAQFVLQYHAKLYEKCTLEPQRPF